MEVRCALYVWNGEEQRQTQTHTRYTHRDKQEAAESRVRRKSTDATTAIDRHVCRLKCVQIHYFACCFQIDNPHMEDECDGGGGGGMQSEK